MNQLLHRIAKLRSFLYIRRRMDSLENEIQVLRDQVNTFKSSLDVPPQLVDEFIEWKAANPIPSEPLVSVTVATYNRARLLTERCIPSILGQSYRNLELIVIGDCCTDETEELVGKIADPRLRFQNLKERGVYPKDNLRRWMVAGAKAMNHAASLTQGQYLTHLDDDDEYTPDRLEKLVTFAVANQCDFVWHPFWWEQPDGTWLLNEGLAIAHMQITNASVFYRSWFKKIEVNIESYRLKEPADWNRYRRMQFIGPTAMRYPEPLLKHYRERSRDDTRRS